MIENICLSGGGVKGYAYIGVLKYLEENDTIRCIKRMSGTSIGAIMCMLFVLGYSSFELQNIGLHLDLNLLENIDINLLITDYGMDNCKKVERLICYLIEYKGFSKDITFYGLYAITGVHLSMTACDIQSYTQKVFDHVLTPDTPILVGCRCSMSIPFIWTPVDMKYIDGCFINNLPIELLPVENTIGFSVGGNMNNEDVGDIKSYASRVIKCLFAKGNTLELDKYRLKGYKVVHIDSITSAGNMNMTKQEVNTQIMSGYYRCKESL